VTQTGLGRLATAIKARRAELGLAQGDLTARGGPSIVTVGQLERGQIERPQAVTLARLERALDWTAGSASRVLAGGEPSVTSVNSRPVAETRGSSVREGDEGDEVLFRLPPGLTPQQRRDALRAAEAYVRLYVQQLDNAAPE
jgi:transcriptional regulator with XRE-family HTH domain